MPIDDPEIDFDSLARPAEEQSEYLKLFIWGDNGTGKTKLVAEAPDPLFIDTENGTRTLRNHPHLRKIPVIKLRDEVTWDTIDKLFWAYKAGKAGKLQDTGTFIFDSMSEGQKRQLDEIVDRRNQSRDLLGKKLLPIGGEYQENTETMRRIISRFRDLDAHLIVTASMLEERDEATGVVYKRPNVTPKLASMLRGIFDAMLYLEYDAASGERKLYTAPTPRIAAKSRIGGLPPVMLNPTISQIFYAHANYEKLDPEQFEEQESPFDLLANAADDSSNDDNNPNLNELVTQTAKKGLVKIT